MLDKTYRPAEVEARIYAEWEASGAFAPSGDGEPFCVMLPPPNVTGSLHMGHALDHAIQDTLVRFERMRGRRVAGWFRRKVRERQGEAARGRRRPGHGRGQGRGGSRDSTGEDCTIDV